MRIEPLAGHLPSLHHTTYATTIHQPPSTTLSNTGCFLGARLATAPTIRLHWYEFCYWLHKLVAWATVLLALIARFDVFWPCAVTWLVFALDKWAQSRSTHLMYIDTLESRCILDRAGKPSKLRLVLNIRNADSSFKHHAASRWIQLSVPNMHSSATGTLTKAVGRAWHPLSLAAQSDSKVELLIDVHGRLRGRSSWSEQLFAHVASLQDNAVRVTMSRALFARPLQVHVRGPFGSAFSRCFEMKHRADQVDCAKHDIVVVFGSGIGLPSALSALHEFVQRRRAGLLVPRFVWFMWQCRTAEELQLCWDSLHRIIYGAKGLCDEQAYMNEKQGTQRGSKVPLDFSKHKKRTPLFRGGDKVRLIGGEVEHVASGVRVPRVDGGTVTTAVELTLPAFDSLRRETPEVVSLLHGHDEVRFENRGVAWDESSRMLEWLGVTIHVSSWKRSAQQEAQGRAAIARDNPLETDDAAAGRVHRWLCRQVHAGYHELSKLLEELDALDHTYSPHQAEPRRLCVSLCGSQRAMVQTKEHMRKARATLRGQTEVSYELAADYHGGGGGASTATSSGAATKHAGVEAAEGSVTRVVRRGCLALRRVQEPCRQQEAAGETVAADEARCNEEALTPWPHTALARVGTSVTFGAGELGFGVTNFEGDIKVTSVDEGGQASLLGVQPGCVIMEVAGVSVDGLSKAEVLEAIGRAQRPMTLVFHLDDGGLHI